MHYVVYVDVQLRFNQCVIVQWPAIRTLAGVHFPTLQESR